MCLFCASKFALLILLFVAFVHLVDGAKAKKGKKAAAEGVAVPKPSPQKNGAKLKKEEAEQQGALNVNIKYAPRIENENMIPDGELDTFLKANSLKDSPKVVANELPSLEKKKSLNAKKTGVEENLENSQVKGKIEGNGDKMEGIGRHDHGRQDGVGQEDEQQKVPPLSSNHLGPQLAQQKQPPQQQEQSFAGGPLLPASNGALSPSSPKEKGEDKENPLSHQNDVPMGGERGKNKEKEEEIEGRENGNNEDGIVEEGNGSINPTKMAYQQQEDDGNKHLNEPKPSAAMGGEMVGDEFGRMEKNGEGEENGVKDVLPSPIHGGAEESQRIGAKAREEEREQEKTPQHGTILEGSETDLKNAEGNPWNGGKNEELPTGSNDADGIMEGDKKGHHLHTDEHLGKPEGNLREAEMPKEVGHNNGGQMVGGGEENVENGIGGHIGTVRNQNNDQIGGNNDAVVSPLESSNGHPHQSGAHQEASQKDVPEKEGHSSGTGNSNLREAEMPVEVRHNNGGQMEGGGRGNAEHGIGGHIGTIRNQNNEQIGGGGHHAVVSSNGHPYQRGTHQEASEKDVPTTEERANDNLRVAEMPVEVRHSGGQIDGGGEGGSGGRNPEIGEGHNGTVPFIQMGNAIPLDAGNIPHSQSGAHQKSSQKDVPAKERHSSGTGNLREAEMPVEVGRNNRGQMDGGWEGGSGRENHQIGEGHNGTVPSIQMGNAIPLDAGNIPHFQEASQKDVPAKERHSSGTGNNRPPRAERRGILASGKENAVQESAPSNGGSAPKRNLKTHETEEKSVNFDAKTKSGPKIEGDKNAAEKNAGNSAAEPINGKRSGTWRNAKKYVEPTMRDLKCEEMEIKDGGERVKCQKWNVIFARINAAENRKKKVIADSKEPSFEIDDYLEEQKEKAKKQSDRERMENGRNLAPLKWNMEIYHKRAVDGKCALIGKGQFVGMRMEVLMALKKECRWTQAELAEHHILEGATKEAAAHQSAPTAAVHDGHSKSNIGNSENTKVEEKVKKDEKSAGAEHAQPNKMTPIEYRKFSVDLKCDKLMIGDLKRLKEEMLECKKWEFILSALKGDGRHQFFSLQKTLDQKTKLRVEKCAKMGIIEMNKLKTHGRASALGKISELRAYRKSNVAEPKIPQPPALSETADCKWTVEEVEEHLWETPTTKNTPH